MKIATKQIVEEIPYPLFNNDIGMWYFNQPWFIIDSKKVEIIGTTIIENSKDVIHTIKTESGNIIDMKMSFIVQKFKEQNNIKDKIKDKVSLKNNNQLNLF